MKSCWGWAGSRGLNKHAIGVGLGSRQCRDGIMCFIFVGQRCVSHG